MAEPARKRSWWRIWVAGGYGFTRRSKHDDIPKRVKGSSGGGVTRADVAEDSEASRRLTWEGDGGVT
jgi:hypothetical protein